MEEWNDFGAESRSIILFILLSIIELPQLRGQVSASLSGTITDPSGAVISGATVTAKNIETSVARTAVTGPAGLYQFFALPVGNYEIRVTKDGFGEAIRSGVRLAVAQDATIDWRLEVGPLSAKVEVTADAPVVSVAPPGSLWIG